MAKGKAKAADQDEVARLLHEAVLKLAASEAGRLKLKSSKGATDGLFPSGATAAVKEAVSVATTGDAALLRLGGNEGKAELFELTPAGVQAVGAAVEHAAKTLSAADAIRQAEAVMAKRPETVVELEPFIAAMAQRREADAEAEAKQRKVDAEREAAVEAAYQRWKEGKSRQRQARITELKCELAELGQAVDTPAVGQSPDVPPAELNRLRDEISRLTGELRAAKAAASDQTNMAPEDAQEFVRNVARRLVSAWAEAAEKGLDQARNAVEVALSNIAAIDPIGEEGEQVAFDPDRHECEEATPPGALAVVTLPGWVLHERDGVDYIVKRAVVEREG